MRSVTKHWTALLSVWLVMVVQLFVSGPIGAAAPAWTIEKFAPSQARSLPRIMQEMPSDLVYSLSIYQSSFQQRSGLSLPLPSGRLMTVKTTWQSGQAGTDYVEMHALKDLRVNSQAHLSEDMPMGHGALTVSEHGVFGELHTDEGWFEITTDRDGTWMIRLDDHRISLDHQCALEDPAIATQFSAPEVVNSDMSPASVYARDVSSPYAPIVQIDVLMLYTEDMEVRYPGELLNARIAHYFNVANQALANTEINQVVLRMVGADKTTYEPPVGTFQNGDAVVAMRTAVDATNTDPSTIDPAFVNLASRRSELGADIISLIWTANIETRGSCGIAYRPPPPSPRNPNPTPDPSFGVNVINDGFTNWSVCQTTVFAHEVGHNLSMGHQVNSNLPVDEFAYAMVVDTVFTTIMRSFGSADQNRYLSMLAFSNPNMNCAGQPCGQNPSPTLAGADAKSTIDLMSSVIADYAVSIDSEFLMPMAKSNPDRDGDGISDWDDVTPFGTFPVAVENPWAERQRLAGSDRAGFDLLVSGTDNRIVAWRLGSGGQAQSLGVQVEAQPAGFPDLRPAFTEFSSIAVRSDGLLFALSGGSVRTYSRQTGQEISTFRGPRYSTGSNDRLWDGFPRALEMSEDKSVLVVLNDRPISFFDPNDPTKNGELYFPNANDEGSISNWRDVAVSADGTLIAAIHDLPQPTVQFYTFGPDPFMPSESIYQYTRSRVMTPMDEPRALVMSIDSSTSQVTLFALDEATQKIYKRLDSDASGVSTEVLIDGSVATAERSLMTNIRDLAIGPDDDLYVLDQGSRSVLRFDQEGQFIEYIVGPDALDLDSAQRMTFARGLVGDEVFKDQFRVVP